MANEVYANTMEVSCKSASGKTICATPDVCMTPPMTPATPPGVPIPYPNTGMASDTTDGSTSVQITGKELMLKNKSCFKKSSGDEAGSAPKKGVVTSKNMGKVYFNMWSMDVKVEGENVVRHLDITTHNHAASMPGNSPPMPYTDAMSAGGAGPAEAESCPICPGAGSPVNPVLGMKFLVGKEDLDFTMVGPLPLRWQRTYSSTNLRTGWFGQGWHSPLEASLEAIPDAAGRYVEHIDFIDAFGRRIRFADIASNSRTFSPHQKMTLSRTAQGQYRIETADGLMYWFSDRRDRSFRLVAITDRNDNAIHLEYVDRGESSVVHVFCSGKQHLELAFDRSRLAGIDELRTAAGGVERICLMRYRYTTRGDLSQVINAADECVREFEYNAGRLMKRQRYAGTFEAWYEYGDVDGATGTSKVTKHADSIGRAWTFDYRPDETVVTDQDGRVTRYHFDAMQRWTGFTDAAGQFTARGFDHFGNLRATVDPAENVAEMSFDERGNPVEVRDASGAVTAVEWHPEFALPTAIIDPLGRTSSFAYDPRGNLVAETDAAGAQTRYELDARGLPTAIHDANGGIKRLRHDEQGQLIEFTDCSGRTTSIAYDANGRLACITNALGHQTTYAYDAVGRLIRHALADGTFELYEHDVAGRLTAVTNAVHGTTRYRYTPDGLVAERIDAAGHSLQYAYDRARCLTELINENGARYSMRYDALDRLVEETRFDGTQSRYEYDEASYLVQATEAPESAERIVTRYLRDARGRVLERSTASTRTTFEYDPAGQLTRACAAHSGVELQLQYDEAGRLTGEDVKAGEHAHALRHVFDPLGNCLETIFPDGTKVASLHYGSGHVHQLRVDDAPIADFERDALHRETRRTQGDIETRRSYQAAGRLERQFTAPLDGMTSKPAEGVVELDRRYRYDLAGRLVATLDRGQQHRYEYDALDRLTRFDDERFAFDPAHNLVDGMGAAVGNRIAAYGDNRYRYDVHGRMVEKRVGAHTVIRLDWDDDHRLVEATTRDAQGVRSTRYLYDALGRRIAKRGPHGTTTFVWNGDRLVQEMHGTERRTFVYEPGSFVPLAQVVKTKAGDGRAVSRIQYFHCDRIGLPREITDAQGRMVWEGEYRAWGRLKRASPSAAGVSQPLRFQGQYEDEETGLHYNRYRYYDPDTAAYLSRDPVGFVGGWNSYQYAPNPTGWIDPTGLAKVKGRLVVYRQLSPADVARLDAGESLQPSGCGGSIAGHVAGEKDGYISASLEPGATEKYASGNGMVAIDVATAIAGGAKFIDHNNVMQAVKREGTLKDVANARDAEEVLFDGEIPNNAVTRCGKGKKK